MKTLRAAALVAACFAVAPFAATICAEPMTFTNADLEGMPENDPPSEPAADEAAPQEPARKERVPARFSERTQAQRAEREAQAERDRQATAKAAEFPELSGNIEWKEGNEDERRCLEQLDNRDAPPINATEWINVDKPVDLARSKGTIFVLSFWSTQDPKSIAAIPKLNLLHKRYADEDVVVIGVAHYAKTEKFAELARKAGIEYPACVDSGEAILNYYCVNDFPDYTIVGYDGEVFMADIRQDALEVCVRSAIAMKKAGY